MEDLNFVIYTFTCVCWTQMLLTRDSFYLSVCLTFQGSNVCPHIIFNIVQYVSIKFFVSNFSDFSDRVSTSLRTGYDVDKTEYELVKVHFDSFQ